MEGAILGVLRSGRWSIFCSFIRRISKAVERCVSVGPLAFTCMLSSPISSISNATSTKGSDNGGVESVGLGHAAMLDPYQESQLRDGR